MTTAKTKKITAAQVIQKYQEAWDRHDANAYASLYALDAVGHEPFHPQPLQGREAIRRNFEDWFKAFPDCEVTFNHTLSKGDAIGIAVLMSGIHRAPLAGPKGPIAATNRRLEMHGAMFCRLNSQGLIMEQRCYYDTANLMQQLGVTLATR